jgi:hypothetical protein
MHFTLVLVLGIMMRAGALEAEAEEDRGPAAKCPPSLLRLLTPCKPVQPPSLTQGNRYALRRDFFQKSALTLSSAQTATNGSSIIARATVPSSIGAAGITTFRALCEAGPTLIQL